MDIEVDFDTVKFGKPALSEASEKFDTVDMYSILCKSLAVIGAQMLIKSDIDQSIISPPSHH